MKFTIPSRADAWDMTRREKAALTFLMNLTSSLVDAQDDLADRLTKIDGGSELMKQLADGSVKLLTEVRRTIPEKQRTSLANTAADMEMRLQPKMTPSKTCVVMQKEDFRTLVDSAQTACTECVRDSEECRECKLFNLLVTVLPLDSYDGTSLCPYSKLIHQWEN